MNLVEIEHKGVPVLVVDEWHGAGVFHGFLGREVDLKSGLEQWNATWGAEPPLKLLQQVHGTEVVELSGDDGVLDHVHEADAWIAGEQTHTAQIFGIKTADCCPVLIRSSRSSHVAALHCGWRGTVAGLLPKTVERLLELGAELPSLEFAIGPAAGGCCYEVGVEVVSDVDTAMSTFQRSNKAMQGAIRVARGGRSFLDIRALLMAQLLELGVQQSRVVVSDICTICSDEYFSHRREKSRAGRQCSFIACS